MSRINKTDSNRQDPNTAVRNEHDGVTPGAHMGRTVNIPPAPSLSLVSGSHENDQGGSLTARHASHVHPPTCTTTSSSTEIGRDVHLIPYELWIEIIENTSCLGSNSAVYTLFSMRSIVVDVAEGEFKLKDYIDRESGPLSSALNRWARIAPDDIRTLFSKLFTGRIRTQYRIYDGSTALSFTINLIEEYIIRRLFGSGLTHFLIQETKETGHHVTQDVFCHCLVHDGNDLVKRDIYGDTLLHAAIREGNHVCAKHILESARGSGRLKDVLESRNTNGRTPLHAACLKNETAIIKHIKKYTEHDPLLKKHLLRYRDFLST